LAKSTDLVVVI